jgi:integrase
MPLTNTEIDKAKAKDLDYLLTDGDGLYLRVTSTRSKLWRYRKSLHCKALNLSLGKYPDVSLAQARERCREFNKLLAQGIHPGEHTKKQQKTHTLTFEAVARKWFNYESKAKNWSLGHATKIIRRMESYIFPRIGTIPIRELKPMDVFNCLKKAEETGRLETAGRQKEYIQRVCSYAVLNEMIEQNPCTALGRGVIARSKPKHMPAITDRRELTTLLKDIYDYRGRFTTKQAMILLSILMVRTGELRRMEWTEINLEAAEWRIPAEKMKAGQPHIVPLPRQAVETLTKLKEHTGNDRYAFPGQGKSEIMSENTVNYALHDLGYKERHCGHGFRGTASTILHELGYPSQWIEAQLAHKDKNEVRAAYCHTSYLNDRRRMLQEWADFLDQLREGGKVIPFFQVHNE